MKKIRIYKPLTLGGKKLNPDEKGIEVEVSDLDAERLERKGFTKREPANATAPTSAAT